MEITINIPAIGIRPGTIGWLQDSIKNGKVKFTEGLRKDKGFHSLFLKSENGFSQYLAGFNQYDLPSTANYDIAAIKDRESIWTDNAWKYLMLVAQKWCDVYNKSDQEEKIPELKINIMEA